MKKNVTIEKAGLKNTIRMFKGVKLPWLTLILYGLVNVGTIGAGLLMSGFTGQIVDLLDAEGNFPADQLVILAVSYLLIGVCSMFSAVLGTKAGEQINLGLRNKLWKKILYTKQSCYDKDNGETLVSRITSDCSNASALLVTLIGLLTTVFSIFSYVGAMYAISVPISNVMLLLIPVSILIGWAYAKTKFIVAQKTQLMLSRTTTYLIERTSNWNLLKTSNAQEKELVEGEKNFDEQYKMAIKAGLINQFMVCLQTLYNIVAVLIPFIMGASLVDQGILTVGDVVAFYGISGSVGTYFTNVMDQVGSLRHSSGALARVMNTMNLPDEEKDTGKELDEPDADIVFENVTFAYEEDAVLKNITCTIPKNKVTAVIGANGSGKSTLFKLAERLYDPQEGSIKFGSTDIKEYSMGAWRKAICTVPQGASLLEGTIRENMCYGCKRDISQEELEKVGKLSRVADFVEQLPDGYDTMLCAGGENLSGGQRQMIAIARAMMSSPDYLLLDEATSNLDVKSENAVMAALNELMKDRTTVIIAHSLATIRNADYVIVLKDGCVEACGTPKDILSKSDNYLARVMSRKTCPV